LGWITDKFSPLKSAIISYVLVLIASLLMIISRGESLILYVISFSLLWLILGAWFAIAPASTIILFGEKYIVKIMELYSQHMALGQFLELQSLVC